VVLPDPVLRRVLAMLDGTRTAHDVGVAVASHEVARASLRAIARAALLVR
jgi:hypothetical protein